MNQSLANKLVLCDLDNLLLDADGNLTQVIRDVLQLFSSRGGRFTVFSQRTPKAVRAILGSVRLSAPALVCGGTLAYHFADGSRQPLCSFAGQDAGLFASLPSAAGVGIALQMRDGSTRAVRMSEGLVFHLKQEWTPFVLSNAADVKGEDVLRILFYQDKKQMPILPTLQKALGENGTLLLPALTYENVTPEHPVFDADKTVPCIGLLPRTFWKMPGAVRSVHPTHSVCARGKRAAELTALHGEDITPVGKNSPFMKLPEIGGRLLFIGEVLDCCTFMHGVEERFGTDYVLTKEKIRYVVNGEEKYMYGHDFKGWETTYRRVKEILDPAKNEIVTGKIGDATCYLIDAKALLKRAEEKLQENQHWFVVPRE